MNRDELVERVARALCVERGVSCDDHPCDYFGGDKAAQCRYHVVYAQAARAALAIIEPAVKEDIARELDCACDCRDAVLAATTKTDRWRACGRDPCSALDARDIRAGAKP